MNIEYKGLNIAIYKNGFKLYSNLEKVHLTPMIVNGQLDWIWSQFQNIDQNISQIINDVQMYQKGRLKPFNNRDVGTPYKTQPKENRASIFIAPMGNNLYEIRGELGQLAYLLSKDEALFFMQHITSVFDDLIKRTLKKYGRIPHIEDDL